MPGIRTSAAAEMLGVSPSTLRTWERRLGYPRPQRSSGNHRQYELAQIEALREALRETSNISSAIELAQRRGRGPTSPARLLAAFDRFDEPAADRELEESLAVRTLERTLEEVLMPALETAAARPARDAELEYACRWATGWLHGARRLAPPASRPEGVLLLDAGPALGLEAVYAQALELCLRRAGLRVLLLSADLEEARYRAALRALEPTAAVLCGADARLDVFGDPLRRAIRAGGARPFAYRGARLVGGREGMPELGGAPAEAATRLVAALNLR
jgi:MerR family transcriptional regulator, light-induced transcriptional regulator